MTEDKSLYVSAGPEPGWYVRRGVRGEILYGPLSFPAAIQIVRILKEKESK